MSNKIISIVALIILAFSVIVVLQNVSRLYLAHRTFQNMTDDNQPIDNINSQTKPMNNSESTMSIESPTFDYGKPIPINYTCDGENINPPLELTNIPQNTVSLALIIDDPDGLNGDWVHWLVWNIDPTIQKIEENSVPQGTTQGKNDFGANNYNGPCPPSGSHRYQFKLFALDTFLDPDQNLQKNDLIQIMEGHILSQTLLVGTYARK